MEVNLVNIINRNLELSLKNIDYPLKSLLYYKRALSGLFILWRETKSPEAFIIFHIFYPIYKLLNDLAEEDLEYRLKQEAQLNLNELLEKIISNNIYLFKSLVVEKAEDGYSLLNQTVTEMIKYILLLIDIKESYLE